MATEADLLRDVRLEIGDNLESFRDSIRGVGVKDDWDLPGQNLKDVTVFEVTNDGGIVPYADPTDYILDKTAGIIKFNTPPAEDALIVVEGTMYGIFTDDELERFLAAAVAQHLKNRTTTSRYRDGHGFIKYDVEEMTLADLPAEEHILVTLLTSIEALWALSTDAATDIDVQTSEGTNIPRGQRYRQLTAQVDLLTEKYKDLSLAMGVGLWAPEVLPLRRVSRTTGRLVPIFKPREYDEHGPPQRVVPPRSDRDVDRDGPENPYWSGGWGF